MAMLCSLFENNRSSQIVVHLLYHSLSNESQEAIKELCDRYKQQLCLYDIDEKAFSGIEIKHGDLSIATFYRLLLPSLLDESISKILHLDCDVIVLEDIHELFEIDLTGFGVAAIKDSTPGNDAHRRVMGQQLDDRSFCAGVMMINLDYWREHDSQSRMLKYANEMSARLVMEDQDVLNHEFHGRWFQLPYKYGYAPMAIVQLDRNQRWSDIKEYVFSPSIIHYATHVKPWLDIRIPMDECYWKYVKLSGFPNPKQTKVSDVNRKRIQKTKLRYYINFYIRPFIPNVIELLLVDCFDLLMLASYIFRPKKFKEYRIKRWMAKYNMR